LLLLCFFITFFLPATLTPYTNDAPSIQRPWMKNAGQFSPSHHLVHLCLTMANIWPFASMLLFFLGDRMGWHGHRLGIGPKGLRKQPMHFFWVRSLFHCRLSCHCTFKEYYFLAHSLRTSPLTLLTPLTSFFLLHSVDHYTRLVIHWQVLHIV
jgi:hypothetical protein